MSTESAGSACIYEQTKCSETRTREMSKASPRACPWSPGRLRPGTALSFLLLWLPSFLPGSAAPRHKSLTGTTSPSQLLFAATFCLYYPEGCFSSPWVAHRRIRDRYSRREHRLPVTFSIRTHKGLITACSPKDAAFQTHLDTVNCLRRRNLPSS